MVVVLPHDIQPFLRNLRGGIIALPMVGGKLAPHRKPHDIRIIEKTLVLHFLVFSYAVKTNLICVLDV